MPVDTVSKVQPQKGQHRKTMSWQQVDAMCRVIARDIEQSPRRYTLLFGIPRGGLFVALRLSHLLNVPIVTYPMAIDRTTLFCDDIVESGETYYGWVKEATRTDPADPFDLAVLVRHRNSPINPRFSHLVKEPDEWIEFPWEAQ